MLLMLTSPFTVEAPFTPVTDYREWTTHGAPLVARFTKKVLEASWRRLKPSRTVSGLRATAGAERQYILEHILGRLGQYILEYILERLGRSSVSGKPFLQPAPVCWALFKNEKELSPVCLRRGRVSFSDLKLRHTTVCFLFSLILRPSQAQSTFHIPNQRPVNCR